MLSGRISIRSIENANFGPNFGEEAEWSPKSVTLTVNQSVDDIWQVS